MKSSALFRSSVTLGLWLLLVLTAHAGTVNTVFVPETNVASTNDDDQLVQTPLHWYSGAIVEFFYLTNNDGTILLPPTQTTLQHIKDPVDVRSALQRAIDRWINAPYKENRNFNIYGIAPVSMAPANPFVLAGEPPRPQMIGVDGYNVVDFINPTAGSFTTPSLDANEVARTYITYFEKDYPMTTIWSQAGGVPQEFIGVVDSNQGTNGNTGGVATYAGYLLNVDPLDETSNLKLFVPLRDYKKGEIFDVDIEFNQSMTLGFRAWPENYSDVPAEYQSEITKTLDIEMIMMHQLGWAFGLGNSMIYDSVMYPYYNLYQPGTALQYSYLTDQFRKRKFSFDDQITCGMAWNSSFNSSAGAISGQVLDGALVNSGATLTNTTAGTTSDNPFVIQVPVFLGVRPEQRNLVSTLNNGYIDDTTKKNPDVAVSVPATADSNAGNWRMVAQVMTGQNLAVPASQGGFLNTLDISGSEAIIPDVGDGSLLQDIGVFTSLSRLNSVYTFPGLPVKDSTGNQINYCIFLPQTFDGMDVTDTVTPAFQISRLGTGVTVDDFFVTPFQAKWLAVAGATIDYPSEFYGGLSATLTYGDGSAPININTTDDLFMNNYVVGEMDTDGRIAASINSGPQFLSGYGIGPRSYVVLNTKGYSYTNKVGPIGTVVDPVVVRDATSSNAYYGSSTSGAGASGSWQMADNFKFKTEMKLSSQGGLTGLPAGIEVTHTVTNLSNAASTFTLRQVLDTNIFGRENPVYFVGGKKVTKSISYQGSKIPQEIVFQSCATSTTAIRAFVDISGGNNTTPRVVTIGLLSEMTKIISSSGGTNLCDVAAMSQDSGIALTWATSVGAQQQRVIRYIVGYYPGGKLVDSWMPWTETLVTGTTRNGGEDDPNKIQTVNVTAGQVTDGIDIFTNTGETSTSTTTTPVPEGSATGVLQFIRLANGFPDYTQYVNLGGALGDIDNDGDLDVVTNAITYGGTGGQNRIYINEQQINANGSTSRIFRDGTYGDSSADGNRLSPLHTGDNTMSVVMADFDDDGWQELVFINQGSPNRYYDNLGAEKPGYFVEDTNALPGLLNGPWETDFDIPYRAAAGDIDSDGDLDLIISQRQPYFMVGQGAWLDSRTIGTPPAVDYRMHNSEDDWASLLLYNERVLINYKYTPKWARNFNLDQRKDLTDQVGTYFVDESWGSDDRPGTLTSLETARHTALYEYQYVKSWDPSELDRIPPAFPSTFNVSDEGEPSRTFTTSMGSVAVEPHLGPLLGGSALDLMSVRMKNPTNYEGMITIPHCTTPSPAITDFDSFITVGTFTVTEPDDPDYGADSAYMRNLDLFNPTLSSGDPVEVVGDGVPDGYFGLMNYNMDYGISGQDMASASGPSSIDQISTDGGLFVFEEDNDTSSSRSRFRYDAYPLFIGMPQGNSHDKTLTADPNEYDIVPSQDSSAFCGLIGDWQNASRPMPLVFPTNPPDTGNDSTNGVSTDVDPYIYTPNPDAGVGFSGRGVQRGETISNTTGRYWIDGWATQYFDSAIYPYAYSLTDSDEWLVKSFTRLALGQAYGAASGDFDRDGDEDVFIVNSSTNGMSFNDWFYENAPPAPKQLFMNDSYGVFTESVNALLPNDPVNGTYCAAGDLDNDGDIDLVCFNAFSPNEAYMNQAFTSPPNLLDKTDSTMFYDGTYSSLPNIASVSFMGSSYPVSSFTGVTVGAAVADLNMDGRPDLVLAEGGKFTVAGDYARVLLNGGKPMGEGVPIYKPGGAAYPPPRTDLWVHNLVPSTGYYDTDPVLPDVKRWLQYQRPSDQFYAIYLEGYLGGPLPGFINDVIAGDVDNDGDPDLMIVRSGESSYMSSGPQLLLNNDSDDPLLNSIPDSNAKGDAIFSAGASISLSDPGSTAGSGDRILKNQGQKAKFGNFNGDKFPDVVIANGDPNDPASSGMPNVILMNSKTLPGHFTDTTETALPTVTEGTTTHGVYDNTVDVAVGDFDSDGNIDILFANQTSTRATTGFRLLLGDGNGHFTETAAGSRLPAFAGKSIKGIAVADIDGLGEPTEDKNHNGILDPGEDTNGNGQLDWTDLASETTDQDNDGKLTVRHAGIWDGSLDIIVSFDDEVPAVLINNPAKPGYFTEESSSRLIGDTAGPNRGMDIGDINLDGYPDLVIAQHVGGIVRPVKVWLNQPQTISGKVRWGFFKDITYEIPYPRGVNFTFDVGTTPGVPNDTSYTGWAEDVKLLDVDGDGDLDLFVATGANQNQTNVDGAMDMMFINRVIGDGFNFKGYSSTAQGGSPNVVEVSPRGVKRGLTGIKVTIVGENLKTSTMLSFGSGVTVASKKMLDSTSMQVTLNVDATAPVGPRSILAQNPSGSATATKSGLFNVYDKTYYQNEVSNRTWTLYP